MLHQFVNDGSAYSVRRLDGEKLPAGFAVQNTIKHGHAGWWLAVVASRSKD